MVFKILLVNSAYLLETKGIYRGIHEENEYTGKV